jgi:hypothetical protein
MAWTVTGNHRITLPPTVWEPGDTIPANKLPPDLARFLEEAGHITKQPKKESK